MGAGGVSDDRDMIPVGIKLDDWGLSLERPRKYARQALADPTLVDEADQAASALGFVFERRPGAPFPLPHGVLMLESPV